MQRKIEREAYAHMTTTKEIYEYLCENCNGKNNGRRRSEIAALFGLKQRDIRRITQEINTSSDYDRMVSTKGSIYICADDNECRSSIRTTYRSAVALIKKARQMEKKLGLHGQTRIVDNGAEIEVVEAFKE